MNAHSTVCADEILSAANRAALEIAPLFALDRFVATNPFLGHASQPFVEAARELALTHEAQILPSREAFRATLAAGDVSEDDIAAALAAHDLECDSSAIHALRLVLASPKPPLPSTLPTAAELMRRPDGTSWSSFVIDQLSQFCAAQAAALMAPQRGILLSAWRDEVELDWSAAAVGLAGLQAHLRKLPRGIDAMLTVGQLVTRLPTEAFGFYLKRLLSDVAGWAAFWRGRQWDEDQHAPGAALDLLAMRLGWDIALIAYRPALGVELRERFMAAMEATAEPASRLDEVLQDALENAWRRKLFGRLAKAPTVSLPSAEANAVHAVFCIDVRSEPLRRALESQDGRITTGSFAGFFGLPLKVMGGDREAGVAHCPVLISPSLVAMSAANRPKLARGWNDLLESASRAPVTSLGFVETLGLGYALKHMTAAVAPAFGKAKPAMQRKPEVYTLSQPDGTPLDLAGRTDFAAAMLRGMGLTTAFAPIVVLVGHGASTRNNAHATSLNCGACGGHSGEANAVAAAELLNDPAVRHSLATRGIVVPAATIFLPALHDTTTNTVTFLLDPALPVAAATRQAMRWFQAATQVIECPRHQPALPGTAAGRSQDWSVVRPEWGLTGCAAFIAGPRAATRHVDLEGSAFLHTYDYKRDDGFAVLEQILTAPLVVASWINLQYFAATRDNKRFGGGNKLIHNVVAGIGVIEGAGGDLKPGLPLQSLHDGENFVHAPLRLTALVEAPGDAILSIVERHEHVRHLLDNHWISLFRTRDGVAVERYISGRRWLPLAEAWTRDAA